MAKSIARVSVGKALVWPKKCALCLGVATKESPVIDAGKVLSVPYCDTCYAKVNRHVELQGGLAMIALMITVIAVLTVLIVGAVIDVRNILQFSTCGELIVGGPLFSEVSDGMHKLPSRTGAWSNI